MSTLQYGCQLCFYVESLWVLRTFRVECCLFLTNYITGIFCATTSRVACCSVVAFTRKARRCPLCNRCIRKDRKTKNALLLRECCQFWDALDDPCYLSSFLPRYNHMCSLISQWLLVEALHLLTSRRLRYLCHIYLSRICTHTHTLSLSFT